MDENISSQLNYRSTEWSVWSCFIHYDRLYGLCKHLIYNIEKCRWLDLYIDMNSVLGQMFIKNYKILDYNGLTSAIINMAIHYRDFFRQRLDIHARVFIIYSNNFPAGPRMIVPEYNHRNYLTYVNNGELVALINHNRELLEMLCKYIEGIYFVEDENQETAYLIKDIIADQLKFKYNAVGRYAVETGLYPNIIITKDLYNYQLVCTDSFTFILRPRKIYGEDKSWCVSKKNIFKAIKKELGGNVKAVNPNSKNINVGLLSLFFSISGLKSRNIRAIHTFNKTIDIFLEAINNNKILNEYNSDPEYCINALGEISTKIAENKQIILNRYNAIDLNKNYSQYIITPAAMTIRSSLIDLISPMSIRKINEQFFQQNPIDVNRV